MSFTRFYFPLCVPPEAIGDFEQRHVVCHLTLSFLLLFTEQIIGGVASNIHKWPPVNHKPQQLYSFIVPFTLNLGQPYDWLSPKYFCRSKTVFMKAWWALSLATLGALRLHDQNLAPRTESPCEKTMWRGKGLRLHEVRQRLRIQLNPDKLSQLRSQTCWKPSPTFHVAATGKTLRETNRKTIWLSSSQPHRIRINNKMSVVFIH